MQKLLRLKMFIVLEAILFVVPVARAQNPTIVSGTIADANSVPYYPATVTACLTPTTIDPIANRIHINNSVGQNYCVGPVSTSASGFFSASIPPNSSITPGGTQYVFTVSALGSSPPSGKGPQIFRVTITVSGNSQDVSATLNASAPNLLFGGGGGSGAFGPNFSVGGGTAQAQTVSPTTPVSDATLVNGFQICWAPAASNTGAAPTLAGAGSSTFTAHAIFKGGGLFNLIASDILFGAISCAIWDGTAFELQNPLAGLAASASLTLGGGASAAGSGATGGFACGEATNTGFTPTVGQLYKRCDNTLKTFVSSLDGAAETPDPTFDAVPVGGKCLQSLGGAGHVVEAAAACGGSTVALSSVTAAAASNTIANGNNPQTLNWAQTTDSQTGIAFGETSAATGGTLTSGLANQAEHSISTASNSTATPFNITQGAITNTVATPLAQYQSTWNNAGGTFNGLLVRVTDTARVSASCLAKFTAVTSNQTFCYQANGVLTNTGSLSAGVNLILNANANAVTLDGSGATAQRSEVFPDVGGTFAIRASAPIHATAQTAAISTATLCAGTSGNCGGAGNYTVEWAFTQVGTACGTPGTGGVTFLLTWTDQNGTAHTATSLAMDDAASLVATTGTFHFTTSNATAWASGQFNLSSNGSIIQYATGYVACGVGTGSYQLDAWVTRRE